MRGFMVRDLRIRVGVMNIHGYALFTRGCFYETENIAFGEIWDFTTTATDTRDVEFVNIVAFLSWIIFDIRNVLRAMYQFKNCVERLIVWSLGVNHEFNPANPVIDVILLRCASLVNVVEQLDIRGLAEESLVEYLFVAVEQL